MTAAAAAPFVPRHPPLDLAPIDQRIAERDDAAARVAGAHRETIASDTEMLRALRREVCNLRLANAVLKDVIDAMQRHRGRR